MVRIERTILANLITNEPFVRKALPFINEKYFHDSSEKIIFQVINQHIREYNTLPTKEVTSIAIQNVENLGEPEYKKATDIVNSLENRVRTMNNEMIKIDLLVSSALELRPDIERISRSENFIEDGKVDVRRD